MGFSHLILLLAVSCASLAWVPRAFDQDLSKTRRYGVLEDWRASGPGVMMSPEMINRPHHPMEEHLVPLYYDDDFAEPDGLYPKRVKTPYVKLSHSVDGSELHIKPRPDYYKLYRRGNPPKGALPPSFKISLTPDQLKERYAWPRAMDRSNNRENLEYTEKGVFKPRRSKPTVHPNDF